MDSIDNILQDATEKLLEYGVVGVFLIFLMGFLIWVYKQHREERKEWKESQHTLMSGHKEERKEWKETQEKMNQENAKISERLINEIAYVMRDSNSNK